MPGLILALCLAAVALFPLFYPGFFHNHAGLLPAYQALAAGGPGWAPGLDGRIAAGAGLLPYYLLAFLQGLGFDPAGALKLFHALALVLGAAGAYLLGAALWRAARPDHPAAGWQGGLLAAAVYTFLPFHLAATYVRGDPSEALALGLMPWAGALALPAGVAPSRGRLAGLGALVLVLVLCHPGLALGTIALFAALLWATGGRPGRAVVGAGAAGVLAGVALWLPALFAHGLRPSPLLEFAQPAYLTLARWGYGESPAAGMPVQLGTVGLGAGLIALAGGRAAGPRRLRAALGAGLALAVLLSLDAAAPLWGPLAYLYAQPWQVLGLAALALALLAALLPLPAGGDAPAAVFAVVLLAVLASHAFLQPIFLPALPRGTTVLAPFGDRIALLAYRIETPRAGTLVVQLDWQALADGREDYTAFAHLLAPDGHLVAQRDQPPFGGARPTSGWARGEVISDRYSIPLPPDLSPGAYALEVGLYRASDGQRVPVRLPDGSQGDHMILARVLLP